MWEELFEGARSNATRATESSHHSADSQMLWRPKASGLQPLYDQNPTGFACSQMLIPDKGANLHVTQSHAGHGVQK